MPSEQEKIAFSQRLRIALNRFALRQLELNPGARPVRGGADLARQFNLKYMGGSGVSPQAAHKWLNGQVIPTSDKIETLAKWLGVSAHWLHYGPPPEESVSLDDQKQNRSGSVYVLPSPSTTLVQHIEALPESQRNLVRELVAQLYKNKNGPQN